MSCPFWFEKEALTGLPQMGGEKHRELIFVLFGLLKATFLDRFWVCWTGTLEKEPPPSSESTFRTLGATPLLPAATANKEILSNSKRKLSNSDSARNIS